MAALPAQYLSEAFDSGTMYETPGMPPVYSTPSMLSLPINNQLGGNVMMWPYARAGGAGELCGLSSMRQHIRSESNPLIPGSRARAGANVGAAYKVPLQTSVHHDPDANRTDYKRLQLNTTIQNQVSTLCSRESKQISLQRHAKDDQIRFSGLS